MVLSPEISNVNRKLNYTFPSLSLNISPFIITTLYSTRIIPRFADCDIESIPSTKAWLQTKLSWLQRKLQNKSLKQETHENPSQGGRKTSTALFYAFLVFHSLFFFVVFFIILSTSQIHLSPLFYFLVSALYFFLWDLFFIFFRRYKNEGCDFVPPSPLPLASHGP